MIDLQTAVQVGLYAALNGSSAVTDLADVWQNPPEGTNPGVKGLVIIGLVALDGADTKDGGFEKATVPIYTYSRNPDATALYAINSAIRNTLVGQQLTAPGADIFQPVFLGANPALEQDGVTYFDQLRFEMFVQEA